MVRSSDTSRSVQLSAIRVPIFLVEEMDYTPFRSAADVEKMQATIVKSADEAKVIISRRSAFFTAENVRQNKTHLVWTHEPFFDFTITFTKAPFFADQLSNAQLYVFNAHNNMIYTDNYYYAPTGRKISPIRTAGDLNVTFDNKMMSFVASYKNFRANVDGADRSLYQRREAWAIEAQAKGAMRILGRNWPDGAAEGESRYADRVNSKQTFLQQTNFCFCFENCRSDYYITEKLWEAIRGGCLPIFHSNDTIYQSFPRNSFIDGADFASVAALMQFIESMTLEDYIRRTNLCRKAYNHAVVEGLRDASRRRTLDRLRVFLAEVGSRA